MTKNNTNGLDEIFSTHLNEIKAGHDDKLKQSIFQWFNDNVIGEDVVHTKWFIDITGEYDYYHPVKRPLVERHKNEHREEQRNILKQHGFIEGGER